MNEIETSIHQSPNVVFKETISHYKAFNNEFKPRLHSELLKCHYGITRLNSNEKVNSPNMIHRKRGKTNITNINLPTTDTELQTPGLHRHRIWLILTCV